MTCSSASIIDLPDEILLIIFNKLDKIDVLYSLMDVNKRFNRLVRDITYISSIKLITNGSTHDSYRPLPDLILDRFCSHILPHVHQNIECLTLEPISMERILCAGEYPNLRKLDLVNFDQRSALFYLHGKNIYE